MKTTLRLSREPAGEALERIAHHVEMINSLFRDFHIALPKGTVILRDEALARRTTLRVGGPADLWVEPPGENALASVLELCALRGIPVMVLGRGSNLLVRDGGFRGVVVSLSHAEFSRIVPEGDCLAVGAGVRLKQVAVEARRLGLAGLEFLEGIPGSMGGALRMNAGAMGRWTFDVVERMRCMDLYGAVQDLERSKISVEYRSCPMLRTHLALGAVLRGSPAPVDEVRARMDTYSRKRWESQPSQPSAGCTFKNPAEGLPAGRLIDELGLKGTRIGDAMVSDVHANFLVNLGQASPDPLAPIELRTRVREARGLTLETEVEITGEDPT
ncbi:MAG: UDP-N-acetylmuramate dehydrogenase [Verrucomicrobiae bacterium]|nr:UDP-N-acetylmuramate dehydrogenase [Verrucomicrobiae bacterium]